MRFADLKLSLSGAETASIAYDRDAIYQASFDACIRHFVDCLASGAEFETAPADNLETLRLVEDTYTLAGPVRDLTAIGARVSPGRGIGHGASVLAMGYRLAHRRPAPRHGGPGC